MGKQEKNAMVIERFIENDVFNNAIEELRKIYDYAKNNEWCFHLRRENMIFLYYKGIALKIKLYKDKQKFSLDASDPIKNQAIMAMVFDGAKPISQLSVIVKMAMEKFQVAIDQLEFTKRQIERQKEQNISMELEENNEFFIIDIEVVITGKRDEGDLLALAKNFDGTYRFVPIELKLVNKDCTTAVKQGVEFLERVRNNYDDFKNNYMQVYNQKWVNLLNKKPIDITDNNDINEVLVLIITDEKNSKTKKKIDSVVDDAKKRTEYKVEVLSMSEKEFIELQWREQIAI